MEINVGRPQRSGKDHVHLFAYYSQFFKYCLATIATGSCIILLKPNLLYRHNCILSKQQSMKRVTVFCGSNTGTDEAFRTQACLLGQRLAEQNIGLVYGGGRIGLMCTVADGAIGKGGEVIWVSPCFLREREIGHERLPHLVSVDGVHERT